MYLLDPISIHLIDTLHVGSYVQDSAGQLVFFSDGSQFALMEVFDFNVGLSIYLHNFDRCTLQIDYVC